MTTKTDLAWAAGVIDGEGSINITKRSGRAGYYLMVQVGQSGAACPLMLKRLEEIFGGSISGGKERIDTRKPTWKWCIAHTAADSMLKRIRPYVVQKRDQVDLALQFRSTVAVPGAHRTPQQDGEAHQMYEAMRALHRAE